jgi:TPR repeat protein
MRSRRAGTFALSFLFAAAVAAASAGDQRWERNPSDEVARCDRLAAGQDDAQRRAEPVAAATLDAPSALAACRSALVREPENPRLLYQYGRALLAAGRTADAADAWRTAARWEYPAALFDLGRLLLPACDAFDRRYEEQAYAYLRRAADRSHPRAAATLGRAYACRESAAASNERAAYWLGRAVALGDVSAMQTLAGMYRTGTGMPRDLQKAISLLRRAAALGDTTSMNLLGWQYLSMARGRGDFAASLQWFTAAGSAADPEGLFEIGRARLLGAVDAGEREQALSILRDAAARGSVRAREALLQASRN